MIWNFTRVLVIGLIMTGPAQGGSLNHGAWSPTGCGPEPTEPSGLDLTSPGAFNESFAWVRTYQEEFRQYNECMVQEAKDDNAAINEYVRTTQQKAKAFFDKVTADSKQAQAQFGNQSNSSGNSIRRRPGISSSMQQ